MSFRISRAPILPLVLLVLLAIAALAAIGVAPPARAGVGLDYYVEVIWDDPGQDVVLFTYPDGSGPGFDEAYVFGGSHHDATLTVRLLYESSPLAGFPAEDFWLAWPAGNFRACDGRLIPDAPTDAAGWTQWSQPPSAGGHAEPGEGLPEFFVNGSITINETPITLYANSADLSGDGAVNLIDIGIFAGDYFGAYRFRSDLFWDGQINLSDIGRLAVGVGVFCP